MLSYLSRYSFQLYTNLPEVRVSENRKIEMILHFSQLLEKELDRFANHHISKALNTIYLCLKEDLCLHGHVLRSMKFHLIFIVTESAKRNGSSCCWRDVEKRVSNGLDAMKSLCDMGLKSRQTFQMISVKMGLPSAREIQPYDYRFINKDSLAGEDLRSLDLSDADLSYLDLQGANLQNTNLSRVDLQNAKLIGADLTGADLRKSDLRGACLLSYSEIQNDGLQGVLLEGALFDDFQLLGICLDLFHFGADFGHCKKEMLMKFIQMKKDLPQLWSDPFYPSSTEDLFCTSRFLDKYTTQGLFAILLECIFSLEKQDLFHVLNALCKKLGVQEKSCADAGVQSLFLDFLEKLRQTCDWDEVLEKYPAVKGFFERLEDGSPLSRG